MAPTCLECGYTLTPEFLTTAKERADNAREPDTVWLRQIATLVIRIACGALAPGAAIGAFVLAAEAIRSPRYNTWTPVFAWAFVGVFAVGSFLFASWLSILMVPGRRRFEGTRTEADSAHTPIPQPPEHTDHVSSGAEGKTTA